MFEYLEKIIKSEDIFPSIDIDFSKIGESILSFGDIFSNDTMSNLESLSLLKVESVDEIPEKLLESKIEIPESQIQKIIEYLKTDPIIIERISQGINLVDLIEIVKEKKDLIFTESENLVFNNSIEKILEVETTIVQKIKELIPSEYFEKIISVNDVNNIESIKNDLTVQLQQTFESNPQFANVNFENVSNTYFQDIINNVESLNIQKTFFNDVENFNPINNNVENVTQKISNDNVENFTQQISNIFNEITEIFNSDNIIQSTENLQNINNTNINNIEGPTYNQSILEGSTYNEYLSTLNFNNITSEISNLYNEINKTNEYITNADFAKNENINVFDETIINSLTTKFMNKENTEIIEVKEIINNLHEKVLETHHEIEILKEEKVKEPNIQEARTNIQKAEMKNNLEFSNNFKNKKEKLLVNEIMPIQRIPQNLPKFPNIGEIFI